MNERKRNIVPRLYHHMTELLFADLIKLPSRLTLGQPKGTLFWAGFT